MAEDIRLIALDLDGTLLDSDKRLSPRNDAALRRAAEMGVHIVPTTGRFYEGMPDIIRTLPYVRYAISINGAEVYDKKEDRVILREEIPLSLAQEVFAFWERFDTIYDCYQDGWGWMQRESYDKAEEYAANEHVLDLICRLRTPLDDFAGEIAKRGRPIQKTQGFFRSAEEADAARNALKARFPQLSITSSIPTNVEINASRANKGDAVVSLARYLGFSEKQVMAFGDGLNDVPMVERAGFGVAMENACIEAKQAAGHFAPTNDQDGVAVVVEQLLFDGA